MARRPFLLDVQHVSVAQCCPPRCREWDRSDRPGQPAMSRKNPQRIHTGTGFLSHRTGRTGGSVLFRVAAAMTNTLQGRRGWWGGYRKFPMSPPPPMLLPCPVCPMPKNRPGTRMVAVFCTGHPTLSRVRLWAVQLSYWAVQRGACLVGQTWSSALSRSQSARNAGTGW